MSSREFEIHDLGPLGDGISQGRSGRVYIEGALPGDHVSARIYKDSKGIARGEIIKLLEPSPLRQAPPCRHFENCGNCTLQNLKTEHYQQWKSLLVKNAFQKEGLRPETWKRAQFFGDRNRRRITLSMKRIGSKVWLGYYQRRSSELVNIQDCLVADPALWRIHGKLSNLFGGFLISGKTVDLFLQTVGKNTELIITGELRRGFEKDPQWKRSVQELRNNYNVTQIGHRGDSKSRVRFLFEGSALVASFGPIKVKLPPLAFLQPTPEGEAALVHSVLEEIPKNGAFADLFSGCGTFSGPMLERGSVDSFESAPSAVHALMGVKTQLPLTVTRRDLFRKPLTKDELSRYDAVVFDPPRAGCFEQAKQLAKSKCRLLVGISCNPSTFANDARLICDGGFRLKSLQVIDQFIWSHHVEVVGVFSRAK